ncbi:hypothetical protein TVAG_274510 [Trichomonas vaginalis G3]|uniref:Uncharacterized protein n=1 Tax=Trichomonas vaginalis (strain ATCC PRA-98 / G3) TaxID=412133 RepID=A2EB42_TRIV3|nr:hypothetical protein TVAGG3_0211900 [Trichomonas vaginalis G3]XP_051100963.1 hypothetical protein TVAGG3_0354610 [Trichomonas vaginalis G3]EAX64779.1 hypothetical protein TVAG_542150 [Trichomonas vaginalis G3]EAY10088.1 hypothetical protein TVAG_274510 [Trichomonas vaginalis G3]KAI5531544.1 hypothetical protein TVAGG3_0354610 [Trichomonas vaginalis G3]KAI5551291.1 hypothetical protein TVAGG3_0211900 [Trichomonas vaginalis G3]|eukprot:XP_001277709.1 hypothetical protein [Trichomonas vaginalis G3]
MSDRKSSSFRQDTNGCPTGKVLPSDRTQTDVRRLSHKRMSDVPPTESIPKPEEPKAPAPAPQFQQVPPPNYYQFQYKSKRDQEFEEGLNRLRKEYATAPTLGCSSNSNLNPNYYQSQSTSKRDQEFEEGLNRLRKEYATAPIERKLLLNSVKIMFR